VVLVVALGACGSGTSSDSMPVVTGARAQRLIVASAGKAEAAKTARISGHVTFAFNGQRKTMAMNGAVDFRSNAMEFGLDMGQLGLGSNAEMQMRMVDGVLYMGFGSLPSDARDQFERLTGGKHWIRLDPASLGITPQGGSGALDETNPGSTIGALRGVDDVTRVGVEDVRGVATTRYRGVIDVSKSLAKLPQALREQLSRMQDVFGNGWKVDVWVDADGRTRKMAVDVGGSKMQMTEEFEFYDFGAPVDLTAPPADDVVDFATVFPSFVPGRSPVPTA
jgi:hypothetical protein